MKKSVILAALGLAMAASSYGQGLIYFTSYSSNDATGTSVFNFGGTTSVAASFTADLYYALGTVSDPVNNTLTGSITSAPTGLLDAGVVGVTFSQAYAGKNFFNLTTPVTIPGYSSGAVTFEVVAFNGSSYANSNVRGRSGSFTMAGITTSAAAGLGSPVSALGDGGGAGAFQTFYVAPVPEPTTLALAGLGGLASLMALRRKQA